VLEKSELHYQSQRCRRKAPVPFSEFEIRQISCFLFAAKSARSFDEFDSNRAIRPAEFPASGFAVEFQIILVRSRLTRRLSAFVRGAGT
jgi:hypothetical protein